MSLEALRERIAAQQTRFFAIFMQWTDPNWSNPDNFESPDAAPSGSRSVHAMGMYIIAVDSHEAAEAIAQGEPFYRRGLRTYTLCEWSLNEGVAWEVARAMRSPQHLAH